jgi:hypothetical protein
MTPQPLPTRFVLEHVSLTWREALWGYEHQWADWSCLSELAASHVGASVANKPDEIELAGMLAIDSAGAGRLARKLAEGEPTMPEESLRKKWLYLLLRWIFENRERFSDPLALAEEVFCDFGHPLEMARFIRYMPPGEGYDPRQHTKTENEARMLDHWRAYLAASEKEFGSSQTG